VWEDRRVLEPELAEAIEQAHAALQALILGGAGPKKAMFSRRDDVVLANPVQPAVRGRRAVEGVLDGIAAAFRDGAAASRTSRRATSCGRPRCG
jgi:hypothetical protein